MRFFRRRVRAAALDGAVPGDSAPDGAAPGWEEPTPPRGLEERASCMERWRRSEQRAARTWQAWLAAEPPQRPALYCAYERALADEQRAAIELELVTTRAARADREDGLARAR